MKKLGAARGLAGLFSQAAKLSVGGQAVIEGVMMRSPKSFVVAVRRPDGQIVVREQSWETLLGSVKFLRWPFFRGAIVLVESLWNGMSALNFSAEQAMPEGDAPADGKANAPAEKTPEASGQPETASPVQAGDAVSSAPSKAKDEVSYEGSSPRVATKSEKAMMGATMIFSLALGMALFVGLPHLLTWLLGEGTGLNLPVNGMGFHLVDGVFKALIFVGYLAAISMMKDIRRVFEYHGAEHKSIWAFESQSPLTPAGASAFTTLHPRCGTAFILIVLLVSIVLFAAVFPFMPVFSANRFLNQLCLIAVKLPLMFPVAGIAYELQRWSAKESCPRLIKWLLKPGLWMQRITTREPSPEQLEIALVSLRRALGRESGVLSGPPEVRLYKDFAAAVAFDADGDAPAAQPEQADAVQAG